MSERLNEIVNAVRSGVLKTGYPLVETMPKEATVEQERGKYYTAVDNAGNVFLIVNPITWREEYDERGICTRYRPAPKPLMKYSEAHKAIQREESERRARDTNSQKERQHEFGDDRRWR